MAVPVDIVDSVAHFWRYRTTASEETRDRGIAYMGALVIRTALLSTLSSVLVDCNRFWTIRYGLTGNDRKATLRTMVSTKHRQNMIMAGNAMWMCGGGRLGKFWAPEWISFVFSVAVRLNCRMQQIKHFNMSEGYVFSPRKYQQKASQRGPGKPDVPVNFSKNKSSGWEKMGSWIILLQLL